MKTTWDITLTNIEELTLILNNCEEKAKQFAQKYSDTEKWSNDITQILNAVQDYEKLQEEIGCIPEYHLAYLKLQIETNNLEAKKILAVSEESEIKISKLLIFFELTLEKLSSEMQDAILNSEDFKNYKNFFVKLFKHAKHSLSEAEENLITDLYNPAYHSWVKMLSESISNSKESITINGEEKLMNLSELQNLLYSKDSETREAADLAVFKLIKSNSFIAEQEFNSVLYTKRALQRVRKYTFPDESRLFNDQIELTTVNALIDVVSSNFDIIHRLFQLKAKLLNSPDGKLKYSDRIVEIGDSKIKINFEEAMNRVSDVFASVDPKYSEICKEMAENGRVDVFPKDQKVGGAFCTHYYNKLKQYVLLNFDNNLESMLTMAHEFGHAVNHKMLYDNNNLFNQGNSLAIAETASTLFEGLVLDEVIKDVKDPKTKLTLLIKSVGDSCSTIFRQISFYMFERELHELFDKKLYLSANEINNLYLAHTKKYMGEFINVPDDSGYSWIYISHFRSPFYVYSYASGLLVSKSLKAQYYKTRDSKLIDRFLSMGDNASPAENFIKLGVDINSPAFFQSGIDDIRKELELCEELAKDIGYNL